MKIITYLDQNDRPKITSYKMTINEKVVLFDCGNIIDNAKDVDYIFISHEHQDHWKGLIDVILNTNARIFSTRTTKNLICALLEKILYWNKRPEGHNIKRAFANIETLYFEETILLDGLKATLYPSGHTFGSSMIYIQADLENVLYTGDMDYQPKNVNHQYYFPLNNKVDYLIVDGTTFIKDDIKKQSVQRIRNFNNNIIKINVRPEKAVYVAHAFINTGKYDDYKVFLRRDLSWYIESLHKQGYPIFTSKKILLETQKQGLGDVKGKKILISNDKYDVYNKDYMLSLHISHDDLVTFIHSLVSNPNVYIGHYNLNSKKRLVDFASYYDFNVLDEGVNK